jgi:hypothetical protein
VHNNTFLELAPNESLAILLNEKQIRNKGHWASGTAAGGRRDGLLGQAPHHATSILRANTRGCLEAISPAGKGGVPSRGKFIDVALLYQPEAFVPFGLQAFQSRERLEFRKPEAKKVIAK